MPSEAQQQPWQPANWCTDLCRGGNAHTILSLLLSHFQKHLDGSEIELMVAEKLEQEFKPLGRYLEETTCPKLYAYAIQTLRRSAFINVPRTSNLVWSCHHLIVELWDKGYNWEKSRRRSANRIFRVDDFLETWIRELPYARQLCLPHYIGLLKCEGFDKSPRLKTAIESLVGHIVEKVIPTDAVVGDRCGIALVQDVFDPMLAKKNRKKLIEYLPLASRAAGECALCGHFESIKRLQELLEKPGRPRYKEDGSVPQRYQHLAAAYHEVCSMLSETRRTARGGKPAFVEFCQHVDPIIRKVAPWSRGCRLKAPADCHIKLKVLSDKIYEWQGTIKDLTPDGHCYHVCFDDLVDCFGIHRTTRKISGQPRPNLRSIRLYVANKQGQTWQVKEAMAEIFLPQKTSGQSPVVKQSRVLPIRGWRYKYENQGKTGAVIWLENPPAIQDFPEMAEMLPHEGESEQEDVKSLSDVEGSDTKLSLKDEIVPRAPFPHGAEQLLEEIVEWFRNLSDRVLEDRRWEGFWSRGGEPIPEKAISAQIRQALKEYVESREGHLSSEEETGLGPCDYLVLHETDKVVVEFKSSDGEWKQGIDAELATYMSRAKTGYGLFVVFAFNKKFRPDSDEIKDLLRRRDGVCKKENIHIDIVVISCDKPVSASRRKKPPSSGEGFQYYKRPSPAPKGVQSLKTRKRRRPDKGPSSTLEGVQ